MPVNNTGYWIPPTTVHPSDLHAPLPSGVRIPIGYNEHGPVPPLTTPSPAQVLGSYYSPKNVVGLRAARVPAASDHTFDATQVIVEFRLRTPLHPSTGMPLRDILIGNTDILEGANDPVLTQLQGRKLRCSIIWTGYKPEEYTISVIGHNGAPLTRFELGQQITAAYASYISNIEKRGILSTDKTYSFPGPIALHQGLAKLPGVQLLHLQIARFRGRIGGVWSADMEIASM